MENPEYIIFENLEKSFGTYVIANKVLYDGKSEYQRIKVFENEKYGRVLRLDKAFQTSEYDEYTYHEPLVHVPMLLHPEPKRVLLIGGGDGGALEEVLKHPSVEKATMVELDGKVIEVAKEYLGKIHNGSFEHPKAEVIVGDGIEYIKNTQEKFDVIILDLTDPYSISTYLYTDEFYREVKSKLNENGVLALHTEMPYVLDHIHIRVLKTLKTVFKFVRPYYNFVPIYGTVMGFAVCSETLDTKVLSAEEIDRRIEERKIGDLHLLNGEVYKGWLAVPNRIQEMLKDEKYEIITRDTVIREYDELNGEDWILKT